MPRRRRFDSCFVAGKQPRSDYLVPSRNAESQLPLGGTSWEYSTGSGTHWTAGSGASSSVSGDGPKNVIARQTDPIGNMFTPVAGSTLTLTQMDNWVKGVMANWTTASDWTAWNGTPAAVVRA
jgi:hypothetical protein